MPALTHGRTKNGFNSFKSNKSNPKSRNSRLVSGKESRTKSNNVVVGRSMAAKRAIQRRTRGSGISVIEGLACCLWDKDSTNDDNVLGMNMTFSSANYIGFIPDINEDLNEMIVKITDSGGKIQWEKTVTFQDFAIIDKQKPFGEREFILELGTANVESGNHNVEIKTASSKNPKFFVPTSAQCNDALSNVPQGASAMAERRDISVGGSAGVDPKKRMNKITQTDGLLPGPQAFSDCINLTKVPLGMKVPNDSGKLFKNCEKLIDANLDTTGVTNMSEMFHGAHAFNGDVSKFDTTNVTDMRNMFTNAIKFSGSVDSWDTRNLVQGGLDGCFNGCSSFTPKFGDNWHIPQINSHAEFPEWLNGVAAPSGEERKSFNKKLADMVVLKDGDFDPTGKFTPVAVDLAARIEKMLGISDTGQFGGTSGYNPTHETYLNFRGVGGGEKLIAKGTPAWGKDFFNLHVSGLQQKKINGELGESPTGKLIDPFSNFTYEVNGVAHGGYEFLSKMKNELGDMIPNALDIIGLSQRQEPKGGNAEQREDWWKTFGAPPSAPPSAPPFT
jgi:surface protein